MYGKRTVKRAQKMSAMLNEPRDPEDIAVFAKLIAEHGYDTVKKANELTAKSKKGSGRRCVEVTVARVGDQRPVIGEEPKSGVRGQ